MSRMQRRSNTAWFSPRKTTQSFILPLQRRCHSPTIGLHSFKMPPLLSTLGTSLPSTNLWETSHTQTIATYKHALYYWFKHNLTLAGHVYSSHAQGPTTFQKPARVTKCSCINIPGHHLADSIGSRANHTSIVSPKHALSTKDGETGKDILAHIWVTLPDAVREHNNNLREKDFILVCSSRQDILTETS